MHNTASTLIYPEPKMVKEIQAESVSGDPLSLCLWCQFSAVFADHTVTWSREGSTLSELKRRYYIMKIKININTKLIQTMIQDEHLPPANG